ncbi:MAG: polysaccharide deacetylase family protein [Bacteroidota bacterium]
MVLIFSENITNRLLYTLNVLFKNVLGVDYEITGEEDFYASSNLPKINYSTERKNQGLFIKPIGLLQEKGISRWEITCKLQNGIYSFFQTTGADLPFDLFSASFYLISRYEEYLPHDKDQHGRFSAIQSLPFKEGFIEEPVVDQWAILLKNCLKKKYPSIKFPPRKYKCLPTIDVDVPYAFKNKPIIRMMGSLAKSFVTGKLHQVNYNIKVALGKQPDPYDTYDKIISWHNQYNLPSMFFFPVGKYGKYDKNLPPTSRSFQKLTRYIAQQAQVGIHPSYDSFDKEHFLIKEIEQLSEVLGMPVVKSRQHYIRLDIPVTYRNLMKQGIKEDYSMGFPDLPGFRAGISSPFPFYDLEVEKEQDLIVTPFCLMDGGLKNYLNLEPDEGLDKAKQLVKKVKDVDGQFCSLWHNSSFSSFFGWDGWEKVYIQMLKEAAE